MNGVLNRKRQRPLSVRALRAFETVARWLSFRAAAHELHLTQPAVSRQIRALEDQLALRLLAGAMACEKGTSGAGRVRSLGAGSGRGDTPGATEMAGSLR